MPRDSSSLTFLKADVRQKATSACPAEAEALLCPALVNGVACIDGNRLRIDMSLADQLHHIQPI